MLGIFYEFDDLLQQNKMNPAISMSITSPKEFYNLDFRDNKDFFKRKTKTKKKMEFLKFLIGGMEKSQGLRKSPG